MEAGSIPNVYAATRASAAAAAGTLSAAWRPPFARALRHAAQMFRALCTGGRRRWCTAT